jgi:hypothetical protein
MRNLLSQQDKKKVIREHKFRIIIVSLLFTFFTMLTALVLLIPSYIISNYREGIMRTQSDIMQKSIESREKNISNIILNDVKIKLKLLEVEDGNMFLADILEEIIDQKTSGVRIEEFFYRELADGNNEILVNGIAVSRESLLQFRKNLENRNIFTKVILPVSNLASDTDIKFSINIIGKF